MNRDDLFRGVVRELRLRLEERTAYNLVKASGLLRQLFLDGTPLINIAKRGRGTRIVFRAMRDTPLPITDGLLMHFRSPAGLPGTPESSFDSYSQDAFLALSCGEVGGRRFAVKHLIKFGAHVLGGVHNGVPKDPEDHVIRDLDAAIHTGEITLSLQALEGIAKVTLAGVDPLAREIGGT